MKPTIKERQAAFGSRTTEGKTNVVQLPMKGSTSPTATTDATASTPPPEVKAPPTGQVQLNDLDDEATDKNAAAARKLGQTIEAMSKEFNPFVDQTGNFYIAHDGNAVPLESTAGIDIIRTVAFEKSHGRIITKANLEAIQTMLRNAATAKGVRTLYRRIGKLHADGTTSYLLDLGDDDRQCVPWAPRRSTGSWAPAADAVGSVRRQIDVSRVNPLLAALDRELEHPHTVRRENAYSRILVALHEAAHAAVGYSFTDWGSITLPFGNPLHATARCCGRTFDEDVVTHWAGCAIDRVLFGHALFAQDDFYSGFQMLVNEYGHDSAATAAPDLMDRVERRVLELLPAIQALALAAGPQTVLMGKAFARAANRAGLQSSSIRKRKGPKAVKKAALFLAQFAQTPDQLRRDLGLDSLFAAHSQLGGSVVSCKLQRVCTPAWPMWMR